MAAFSLYATPKFHFTALDHVVPPNRKLLALEVCKQAFNSAGQKKLVPHFWSQERGVSEAHVAETIEALVSAGVIKSEEVVSPRGEINYLLSITPASLKLFTDAKEESAKAFAAWQAKNR